MEQSLEAARIFVRVATLGSFSKAAADLKLPKSTVSRAVSGLESAYGRQLMVRTTRSLTLTSEGRAFFEACAGPLKNLDDAFGLLTDAGLQGLVRITGPEDLGSYVISPTLALLARENPGLKFETKYTNEVVDLVKDGFDIAVRLGPVRQGTFRATRLGDVTLIFAASPEVAAKVKAKDPREAKTAPFLTYSQMTKWKLRADGRTVTVDLNAVVMSNQLSTLVSMAIEGAGIGLVPSYLCEPHFKSGALVPMFKGWSASSYPVSLVTPLASSSSARLKLVTNRLNFDIKKRLAPATNR